MLELANRSSVAYEEPIALGSLGPSESFTHNLEVFCGEVIKHMNKLPDHLRLADEQLSALYAATSATQHELVGVRARVATAEAAAEQHGSTIEDFQGRLRRAEAALDTLPAWKASYEYKMEDAEVAAQERHQLLVSTCEGLELTFKKGHEHLYARFDALEDIVMKGAEIRKKHEDEIQRLQEQVKTEKEQQEKGHSMLQKRVVALEERQAETACALQQAQGDVTFLQVATKDLTDALGANQRQVDDVRAELDGIKSELKTFRDKLSIQASTITAFPGDLQALEARIVDVEADDTAQRALEGLQVIEELDQRIAELDDGFADSMQDVENRIQDLTDEVERGHPDLLGLLKEFATARAELTGAQRSVAEHGTALQELRTASNAHAAAVQENKDDLGVVRSRVAELGQKLASEAHRLIGYTDECVKPLVRGHQLQAVAEEVEAIRGELKADMQAAKENVKFDLMHENSPQVKELRKFLETQEKSSARLAERLALAEQKASMARSHAAEAAESVNKVSKEGRTAQKQAVILESTVRSLRDEVTALRTDLDRVTSSVQSTGGGGARDSDSVGGVISMELVQQAVAEALQRSTGVTTSTQGLAAEAAAREAQRDRAAPDAGHSATAKYAAYALVKPPEQPVPAPVDDRGARPVPQGDSGPSNTGAVTQPTTVSISPVAARPALARPATAPLPQSGDASASTAAVGASVPQPSHEVSTLARDIVSSLMQVHVKSQTSQAYNDYVRALDSDYGAIAVHKQHCKMMRSANNNLDRLFRKKAAHPTDFAVLGLALTDMRLALVEQVLSTTQQHIASLLENISSLFDYLATVKAAVDSKMPKAAGIDIITGLSTLSQMIRGALHLQPADGPAHAPRADDVAAPHARKLGLELSEKIMQELSSLVQQNKLKLEGDTSVLAGMIPPSATQRPAHDTAAVRSVAKRACQTDVLRNQERLHRAHRAQSARPTLGRHNAITSPPMRSPGLLAMRPSSALPPNFYAAHRNIAAEQRAALEGMESILAIEKLGRSTSSDNF